ncbi:MAG: hydrogenase [Deltaproteobacteria bacterium CG_4_10_14_0_2_um_filter_43_8]|nr:MAG: hydrogenase [Deltaproteobacteria bacterium CG11_big_fil_rev_8_21_14_0_20_42_23]PJA18864.1 MAG: hydrogenase [Deltaproteobacteria bacterium CG_4_10_14_0_2_um_filter_43_8]PJC65075.1 MAG: hydrogenase [Deltaproteobacteria bacterium CG_4_9_14_0_2_um_filter_42_21]
MDIQGNQLVQEPLVTPGKSYADIGQRVCKPLESLPMKKWWICFVLSVLIFLVGLCYATNMFRVGLGTLGLNHPVGWGVFITNFVFWVGIGHAGTLISAVLFLFRQKWRTAINRSAEAMTIFAVMTAGIFPLIHTGRPWLAFWLFPYPNERNLWVNFNSPLLWDVFAVSTYFTISFLFWYTGLIPDIASVRDRAKNKIRKLIYGVMSFGWRGSARKWTHYEMVYLLLAGLSTPLVLSVHSIVSFDFAVSVVPGWHTTIFPPYFVAGAVFSGFAMVVTLLTIVREVFNLKDYITIGHMEKMNKVMLVTGMIVGYAYMIELFTAWYSGNIYERFAFLNRIAGPYAWAYWIMVSCNMIVPQLFWFKKLRRSIPVMFVASIFANIGMWFERFVIVVTSLHRDFLPANWGYYKMTDHDWGITIGSFGFFMMFFLLFCRVLPTICMFEVKSIMPSPNAHKGGH